jgi:hypothetical protein
MNGTMRDRIAVDNRIGAGTVSNILNEWKEEADYPEYKSTCSLVFSKKQGADLSKSTYQLFDVAKSNNEGSIR